MMSLDGRSLEERFENIMKKSRAILKNSEALLHLVNNDKTKKITSIELNGKKETIYTDQLNDLLKKFTELNKLYDGDSKRQKEIGEILGKIEDECLQLDQKPKGKDIGGLIL